MTGSINITPVGLDCALVYILVGNDIPLKIIVIILNNIQVLKRREKEKKHYDVILESHQKSYNEFGAIMSFGASGACEITITIEIIPSRLA